MDAVSELHANSSLDPLAPLEKDSRGQPITVRNYIPVPEDAHRLPALMSFRDVDHAVTVLRAGSAREHAYQKYAIKELAKIRCFAIIMPIGPQKCKVIKKDAAVIETPYLYSISVKATSKDRKFLELAPALNADVVLRLKLPTAKWHSPPSISLKRRLWK